MEEIKVGEYVRLRDGEITKIKAINENTFKCKFHKVNCELFIDYIVNYSKNIIDLIEVGDIVELIDVLNQEIIYIWDDEMLKAVREDIENGLKIGRILTKERFESESYKVKEE